MSVAHETKFPAEILDHILDYLHDDFRTLGACALAGHSLLHASRYHRFNGRYIERNRVRKLKVLLQASPELAKSIFSLTYYQYTPDEAPVMAAMFAFFQLLPNLKDIRIPASTLPYLQQVNSPQLKLTHLRLYHVLGLAHKGLLAGLSMFTNLQELELCDASIWSHSSDRSIVDTLDYSAPSVRTVSFRDTECCRIIVPWLISKGVTPLLYRAKLSIYARVYALAFMKLSNVLAPVVQKLEVVFAPNGTLQDTLQDEPFTLSGYSVIHTCVLRFKFSEMCVPENRSLPWVPKIIGQLSSDALRSLTISLVVDNVEDLRSLNSECAVRVLTTAYFDDMRALDWAAIEEALNSEHLRDLEKVVLEGRGSFSFLEDHIRFHCPALHSRRILTLRDVVKDPLWAQS